MTDNTELPPKASYHHGDLRKALLEAAELELAEKGVEGFTLRGCAKRAHVSHAAPAHHFRDTNAMLTALAAVGFERFVAAMRARQVNAPDARTRLVAAGLGYIDFAKANPALFRLMFSSFRPDFNDPALQSAASAGFNILADGIAAIDGVDPRADPVAMRGVVAAWAIAHGLADLALSGRLPRISDDRNTDLDAVYADIISRSVPGSTS